MHLNTYCAEIDSMYLEHFNLTQPPFAESVNPEIFFPGSRKEMACQSLILDIVAGKSLLKLIGREGSGKTLICRLIEERLPESCHVIVFEHPIGSFDDLLRIVCLDLGMPPGLPHAQGTVYSLAQQVLAQQQAHGIRVVLLIDEAEKLFLTVLERLVRHVGKGDDDLLLSLVLVGRPSLDANLEQMASCSTQTTFSNTYVLEELSESETLQYLRFRTSSVGMSDEQFAEVFTEGVVSTLYNAAKGNLRQINILAEKVLQDFCAEKSFMVLLDQVEPEATTAPVPRQSRTLLMYDLLRGHPILVGALAGSFVLVLGIGLFLNRVDQQAPSETINRSSSLHTSSLAFTNPQPLSQLSQIDGEKIFCERLGASADWLAGMHQGKYTIQLMMLSSPTAESSLAGTLATSDYAPILNQVYLQQKQTNPPTLFVFYGIYDSLDAAREARNSMPVFLRKLQPYPLSISEAVRKIEP
ncbi:MAG: AAA family ATPase [Desulfobulbus sp.]|nr:AAA family ATPase [Desulfobulbus sp.]